MNDRRLRLGILVTHPIQYQVPWFQALARQPGVALTVYFCMLPDEHQQGVGFDRPLRWDLPLLEGYNYSVLDNRASRPSLDGFWGCDTPGVRALLTPGNLDALIIHGWHARSHLQALWACRRSGLPCIARGESNLFRSRNLAKRLLHRWRLRHYAAVLSIGQANTAFYRAHGVAEQKVFSGPYCVDNERFRKLSEQARQKRPKLRRAWGIPATACTFLFCGKLVATKRPLDLVRALARLPSGIMRPAHVLVVGDGALRSACEQEATAGNLAVSFTGFLNQGRLPDAYAAADALVLPSEGETWGLVVNEAMAAGLPAIVSDRVGCHPDLVHPGVTGDVYPSGDVESLSCRLDRWTEDEVYVRTLARNASSHIEGFSVEHLVDGTLQAVGYATRLARPA